MCDLAAPTRGAGKTCDHACRKRPSRSAAARDDKTRARAKLEDPMVDKVEKIWLDGAFVNWDDAKVHVLTHTLHYGLGVFEGIRCYKLGSGKSAIFRLREHIERLFDSAHICTMKIEQSEEEVA